MNSRFILLGERVSVPAAFAFVPFGLLMLCLGPNPLPGPTPLPPTNLALRGEVPAGPFGLQG